MFSPNFMSCCRYQTDLPGLAGDAAGIEKIAQCFEKHKAAGNGCLPDMFDIMVHSTWATYKKPIPRSLPWDGFPLNLPVLELSGKWTLPHSRVGGILIFIRERFPCSDDAVPEPDCRGCADRPTRGSQPAFAGNPMEIMHTPIGPAGFQQRCPPACTGQKIGKTHAHGMNIPQTG